MDLPSTLGCPGHPVTYSFPTSSFPLKVTSISEVSLLLGVSLVGFPEVTLRQVGLPLLHPMPIPSLYTVKG